MNSPFKPTMGRVPKSLGQQERPAKAIRSQLTTRGLLSGWGDSWPSGGWASRVVSQSITWPWPASTPDNQKVDQSEQPRKGALPVHVAKGGSGEDRSTCLSVPESVRLRTLSEVSGAPISCTPHATFNQCRRVVFSKKLLRYSEKKLLEEVRVQKWRVTDYLKGSDHYPILLPSPEVLPTPRVPHWQLDKADLDLLKELAKVDRNIGEFPSSDGLVTAPFLGPPVM
ncbi:hypothetical protein Hamer_G001686 [Homarus americanus]|uniref:Uncharacterized protein n=1 Tax=Homarus americanus TaxID=6706 RepID=A0A8J5JL96_HOMAM|nr:hypothetical protein Hamer_G001686 [Homarus americanus]